MARARKSEPQAAVKSTAEPGKDELLKFYRDMLLIRRFEERAGQLYGMGLIGGFCHLYIGQEAVVVGMSAAMEGADSVITSYRDHGHMLACGMDPKGVMAELTGRQLHAVKPERLQRMLDKHQLGCMPGLPPLRDQRPQGSWCPHHRDSRHHFLCLSHGRRCRWRPAHAAYRSASGPRMPVSAWAPRGRQTGR